jgi:hypothetical protein
VHGSVYEFLRNSALTRNFFDYGTIPQFQRNVWRIARRAAQRHSFSFVNYEGWSKPGAQRPDAGAGCRLASQRRGQRAAVGSLAGSQRPRALDLLGTPSGIAESFSNPQRVREDFGTVRFDQTLSIRTPSPPSNGRDNAAHSPGNNPFTLVDISLREQGPPQRDVSSRLRCSIEQAGFSRSGFYFTVDDSEFARMGEFRPARQGRRRGRRHNAQRASQISNGGTNAGSSHRRHAAYLLSPTR